MSKVTYSLENGQILRDGIAIADYDSESGLLDFHEGLANFRAPVVRWLNGQGMKVDVAPDTPAPNEFSQTKPEPTAAPAPAAPPPAAVSTPPPPAPVVIPQKIKDEVAAMNARKRSISEDELRKRFPGLPAFDKMAGDKTPAVVSHIRNADPAFANYYYEFRVTHS